MNILIILGMFNFISLFRVFDLENHDYKFGKGSFYKMIGPGGFILASLIKKEDINGKIIYILGFIFNLIILITLLIFK